MSDGRHCARSSRALSELAALAIIFRNLIHGFWDGTKMKKGPLVNIIIMLEKMEGIAKSFSIKMQMNS